MINNCVWISGIFYQESQRANTQRGTYEKLHYVWWCVHLTNWSTLSFRWWGMFNFAEVFIKIQLQLAFNAFAEFYVIYW